MAMVLASYVQNMLMEMGTEEVRMLLGVPDEMKKMEVKLRDLKKFLADADRRNITDETVQGWVKDYKGAMYDATDILDLCQLKAMERGPSRDMGCFNPLLFCMRNPFHAHDIGSRLQKLNEKLGDISKRREDFKFADLTSYEERAQKIPYHRLTNCETTGELELGVVGEKIEEDTRNLVELLTRRERIIHENNKVMVFAIVGVGGIGKTTLAKNIFNNETIQIVFPKKIWLSVNHNFDDTDLLERAISEAGGDHQAQRTMAARVQTHKDALKGCKTLIVMDDVWDHRAWEKVLKSPLINALAHGSRVLVTTRLDTVARGMMAEEPYHRIDKLNPEDAWSLLKRQVIRDESDEPHVNMLRDIGMGIVAKCDGLPLAVKVMGGLLLQRKKRRSDWENVLNDASWSESKMPEEINNAIYLISYQDLDPSLKPCFLHFSLLPKSKIFLVDEVIGMWIAEGFIHGGSRDLEEVGRECYNELILRNLIEPDSGYVDQKVCTMHDVVRSFAQYVARDEALAAHSNMTDIIDKLNTEKFIRLSLETKGSESNDLKWRSIQAQMSLRTLISVGPIEIKPDDSLVPFSCLRTLHIHDANCDALAKCLIQLKHLRYLSIRNTNMSTLPENIGKITFLQYINFLGCRSLVKLPHSIGKLRHLRLLNISGTSINYVPKGFQGLINLRKLYGFPAYMDGDWSSLEELGPLSKLIELDIQGLEGISSSSIARKARLSEKVRLNFISLKCLNKWQQQIEEVFNELCPPPCLENLIIKGYFGRRLPRWMRSAAVGPLGNLRTLTIEDLPYCTEFPDSLYQLPRLEFLQINLAPVIKRVGPEFLEPHQHEHPEALENLSSVELEVTKCAGLERICNISNVQELTIIQCPELKVLEGMPALRRLDLEDYDMKILPGYLQNVNPRDLLEIDCDVSLLSSMAAEKSGPEWDKFSHIKQVKAYADDKENNIEMKWYVLYTRDPFCFKTNIRPSATASGAEVEK